MIANLFLRKKVVETAPLSTSSIVPLPLSCERRCRWEWVAGLDGNGGQLLDASV
jgi:hypothetical protein